MTEHIPEDFRLSAYDYFLPEDLIAQQPADRREESRLLALHCDDGRTELRRFAEAGAFLRPGDLLVVNNTKVFPARLLGSKASGGRVELLLLHYPETRQAGEAAALVLLRSSKRPKPGSLLHFAEDLQARVEELLPDGKVRAALLHPPEAELAVLLDRHGQLPLPPYIRRPEGSTPEDALRYQTEYAKHVGSVAAPTAGLHFSRSLLAELEAQGVRQAAVTLHVGYGTFAPVRCEDIRQHELHKEFVRVPAETAEAVNAARAAGGRIWAVGTTTARTLEFAAARTGRVEPLEGLCGLYIYPGWQFKAVDNLITNFHLPQSSLLFLVSALSGRERLLAAYAEAIAAGCRFFSYGDAMAVIAKP
ncbi:MAG: tRNA preQ1(34) S-adenosylmethionine ribosyltransferase-isomerase QueA [Candidatus Electronema sp. V4]|uniref:tRNA preQ1(34) S-adenosylmethionine ribosyltransferase-isomerase QueA n=1 Tax=Candidatus Electronema sp. V4 TaxID=3454756 RepID=UPI0040553EBA